MWKPEHRLAARRDSLRYDSDLTDEEWKLVQPQYHLPSAVGESEWLIPARS